LSNFSTALGGLCITSPDFNRWLTKSVLHGVLQYGGFGYAQPPYCKTTQPKEIGWFFGLVRIKGIEPSLLAKPEPKSGASTNSAISAYNFDYSITNSQSKIILEAMPNPDSTPILTALQGLIDVVAKLRNPDGGCPWDLAQTSASLTPYIIEEAYETVHAIRSGDREAIVSELGDLLLQVVLQAQLASEAGEFTLEDIAEAITQKMIRRHPHVFGDTKVAGVAEVRANWEEIKAAEKGKTTASLSDRLSSYNEKLPPITAAMKISVGAATVGFDWESVDGAWAKFEEELGEFKEALTTSDTAHQESELGDLLTTVINLARWYKLDPARGLSGTNQRFVDRLRQMEIHADKPLDEYSIDELELLWQQAKQRLASGK
jgi:XTP/dITP diphosphohydrolase